MKKTIIYRALIVLALWQLCACTKDFQQINTNPNAQTVGSNAGELLGAEIGAAQVLLDNVSGGLNQGLGKWVEYYTTNTAINNFIPSNPQDDWNNFWIYQQLVTSVIPLLDRVISNTDKIPSPNYRAVALVMKAWIYHDMTNFWGAIPFSDADKGEVAEILKYNKPKFDSQQDIYMGILNYLSEADSLFDLSGNQADEIDANSDAYAGGNLLEWEKFANSLRARILLDMSGPDPSFAKAGLEEIFSNPTKYPVFESNKDNFGMHWESGLNQAYSDPFEQYNVNNVAPPSASSGIVNILGERRDPRMQVFFDPAIGYTSKPTYIGAPPAFDPNNPSGFIQMSSDSVSHISKQFAQLSIRPIMTYSELLFIKAEAALKGINVGMSAEQAYVEGISADMDRWGISSTDANKYIQGSLVKYNPADALEQIVTQRYISQFAQSANTFSLIRRTGFPELDYFTIGINKQYGYPVRMSYVMEEMPVFNSANYQAAIAGEKIINLLWGDKLWFAQNAPDVKMVPTIQTGPVTFSY